MNKKPSNINIATEETLSNSPSPTLSRQTGFFINRAQTIVEEVANAFVHGVGLFIGIACLVLLLVFSRPPNMEYKIVASCAYGFGMIFMYGASTFYHAMIEKKNSRRIAKLKETGRLLDHISIYYMIAGSYTPFLIVNLRGHWGWTLFGVIWALAILGTFFKVVHRHRFEILSLSIYILMGWLVIVAVGPLFHYVAFSGVMWLLAGGLCYTIGAFFYAWETPLFGHTVWHLFVIAGTICHFFAVLFYVVMV